MASWFNWNISNSFLPWFLTIAAIVLGILVAIQTNNHASIQILEHQQKSNTFQLEELKQKFLDAKQEDREFQAEQRQRLLDLAKTLNEIRLEELKRSMRR